ncbi:MAG: hypothetical protein NTW26_01110 [bacterium]|nr:hypothetical protein [bacterium]
MLAALCFCLSCSTGTDGEDGVPHDQTTVMGTLLLFEDVWNDGDMDTYKVLLDEGFTFYFDPQDVGGDSDIPPSWGYTMEIMAVTNLFNAVGAENVDVDLDLSEVTEPEEGVNTYMVRDVPYEVCVYVEDEFDSITYIARGNLDLELKKVDDEWVIINWWDKASLRLPGVEETTWGAIKACF